MAEKINDISTSAIAYCNEKAYNIVTNSEKELKNMKRAYVRVSTQEQSEDRQIEGLEKHGIDKWYIEKVSGKNIKDRPQFQQLLADCKEGDTIYVHDFSRFARSTVDLLLTVQDLRAKGISLVSNKEGFDTSTATGELMLTMIAAINQFERRNMLERQEEGIIIAKRKGAYKNCGRKNKEVDPILFAECKSQLLAGALTKSLMAIKLGVSRPTLNRMLEREGC